MLGSTVQRCGYALLQWGRLDPRQAMPNPGQLCTAETSPQRGVLPPLTLRWLCQEQQDCPHIAFVISGTWYQHGTSLGPTRITMRSSSVPGSGKGNHHSQLAKHAVKYASLHFLWSLHSSCCHLLCDYHTPAKYWSTGLESRGKQFEQSSAQSYQSSSAEEAQKYQKWGQGNHWTCSVAPVEAIWVFYTNTLSCSSGIHSLLRVPY